jgi:hypothetical protein
MNLATTKSKSYRVVGKITIAIVEQVVAIVDVGAIRDPRTSSFSVMPFSIALRGIALMLFPIVRRKRHVYAGSGGWGESEWTKSDFLESGLQVKQESKVEKAQFLGRIKGF